MTCYRLSGLTTEDSKQTSISEARDTTSYRGQDGCLLSQFRAQTVRMRSMRLG